MKEIALAVALLAAALGAAAQDKACTPADEKKAEAAIDRVVNWDLLYKAWQDYKHCDKGSVEESFTEALMRLIVDWKQVDVLAKQAEANREYRDFVHRHINSPAAKGDIDSIYSRATRNCPKGLDGFCKDVATTAKPFAGLEMTAPTPAAAPAPAAVPVPADAKSAPPKK